MSQGSKTSLNHQNFKVDQIVHRGLKRRETLDNQRLQKQKYRDKIMKMSDQSSMAKDAAMSPHGSLTGEGNSGSRTKFKYSESLPSKFDP